MMIEKQRVGKPSRMGMKKHYKMGHTVNCNHFTGQKKSGTKRKNKSTRKQRRLRRGTHVNKYV